MKLSDLHLDKLNPRFGEDASIRSDEVLVLDTLVERYGIVDVISSIAQNGFFSTEPLVAVREGRKAPIVVVEGNRRLAACLILNDDPRAVNQARIRQQFEGSKGSRETSSVPVLIFDTRSEILPYLGVRHIAGSMTWDGYAKAKWIAQVLEENKSLKLQDIMSMIGDVNNTSGRLLEGYYFVNQLIAESRFQPADSQIVGRGSNPYYPFSWIYTVLGYTKTREWLGMQEADRVSPKAKPIPREKLDDAGRLVSYMFGNKTKRRVPVISDSRELIDLAKGLDHPKVIGLLDEGVPLQRALEDIKSADDKASNSLVAAVRSLTLVQEAIGSGSMTASMAEKLLSLATEARRRSVDIHKRILGVMSGADDYADEA